MPWIRERATGRLVEVVQEHPYIRLANPEWEPVLEEPEPEEPEPEEPERKRRR